MFCEDAKILLNESGAGRVGHGKESVESGRCR